MKSTGKYNLFQGDNTLKGECIILICCAFFITCNTNHYNTNYFRTAYKDLVDKNNSKNLKEHNNYLYSFETVINENYSIKSIFVYKYLISNQLHSITNTLYKDGKRLGKYGDEFIFFDSTDNIRQYRFNLNDSVFTYQIEYINNDSKTKVLGTNLCNYPSSEYKNSIELDVIYSVFGYESIKVYYKTKNDEVYKLKKIEKENYSPFLYKGSFVFTSKESTDTIYLKSELENQNKISTTFDTLLRKGNIIIRY